MRYRDIIERLKKLERKILPPSKPIVLSLYKDDPIPEDTDRMVVVIGAFDRPKPDLTVVG